MIKMREKPTSWLQFGVLCFQWLESDWLDSTWLGPTLAKTGFAIHL